MIDTGNGREVDNTNSKFKTSDVEGVGKIGKFALKRSVLFQENQPERKKLKF